MNKIGDKKLCLFCNQEIELVSNGSSGSDLWIHKHGRWSGDNGYWCYQNNFQFSANGQSKEEYEFRKENYSLKFENGCWMVTNSKTEQKQKDPYWNE